MADQAKIGDTVYIKIDNEFHRYTISDLGTINIDKMEISSESPMGKALIGRRKNDIVEVSLPGVKNIKCEILKIKKNMM